MDKKGLVQTGATQWVTPRVEFKGSVGAILKQGGGKLSITGGDPGEMRCQKGLNPKPCGC